MPVQKQLASRSQPLAKGGPGPMPIPELYPLQRTVQTNQIAERGLRHVVYTYGFSHRPLGIASCIEQAAKILGYGLYGALKKNVPASW